MLTRLGVRGPRVACGCSTLSHDIWDYMQEQLGIKVRITMLDWLKVDRKSQALHFLGFRTLLKTGLN